MDIKTLRILIDQYFKNNPTSKEGRVTEIHEFETIDKKVLKNIPDWYKEILTAYPLVGLEIGIPNDFGDEDYIGKPLEQMPLMGITFIAVKEIEKYALGFAPDYKLIDLNYIRIAEDKFGTQEGIFIDSKKDDPAIRLIFHDFGDDSKQVLRSSELLLENFSDIFKYGKKREMDQE